MQPYSISPLSITIHATALFCFSVRVTVIQFRFFFCDTEGGFAVVCANAVYFSLFFLGLDVLSRKSFSVALH